MSFLYVDQIGVGMTTPTLAVVNAPNVFGMILPVLELAAVPTNIPVVFSIPKKAVPDVLVN